MSVDEIFDHPAFANLKSRAAAFVVVRPETRGLIWANAAASAFWDRSATALQAALFGPPGKGWIGTAVSTVVPGRPPQMFRTGLAPGLGMRGSMILARAMTGSDGRPLVGVAVPGTGGDGAPADAWRCGPMSAEEAAAPENSASDGSAQPLAGPPSVAEALDGQVAGTDLARRSQLAVLRDRLMTATDGATTLRFLWRTDARDGLTQIDERLPTRLGAPLATGSDPLPDIVARFDPAAGARLAEAFAARTTWSGVALRLPVAGGAGVVPTLLSGSPAFGRDRGFEGYRGFGMVDLAGLEARPSEGPADAPVAPAPIGAASPTSPAETPEEHPPETAGIADPRDLRERTEPASLPDRPEPDAKEPMTERTPYANVVDLRSFHTVRSSPPSSGSALPEPDAEEPLDDEMAFLALGAALRAQIGDAEVVAGTPDDAPPEAPHSATADLAAATGSAPDGPGRPAVAAALLDRLPVPALVLRDREAVYANAAAARALAFDDPRGLVAVGPRLAVETVPSGLALRDGRGRAVVLAAQATVVDWEGVAATLWTFGPSLAPRVDGDERPVDLIDRVDDAVALLDGEGRIRRLNERGRAWFVEGNLGENLSGESFLGESVTTLLAPESRASALQLLEEARTRGDGSAAAPPRREVSARTAEGSTMPMLLTLGRLGSAGFYATLRDVSALRRAERDEAQSRGARERDAGRLPDLLARVSHEIRTPLNAILGFAEVMMDERFGPLGSPRYRDYLKDIHTSGTQVVTLVGDLLDLSRIEAGRLDLDVGAVDVNKVVSEIVAQMQPEANRGRVIVRTSLASRIPAVVADERSARQIVQHLLSNAVKFNEPGGQVIVSTTQEEGGAVVLRIRDTGVGMTEAEIAAALEPFHDVSPPRPANGNGLGLPLARALVGANGASLSIRSRPREGTLVEVSFPAAPSDGARWPA